LEKKSTAKENGKKTLETLVDVLGEPGDSGCE
jgi:hypothetical protein